jgi:hypothetical protein
VPYCLCFPTGQYGATHFDQPPAAPPQGAAPVSHIEPATADLSAVQLDDLLLDQLGSATPMVTDELGALALAWRQEIDAAPMPGLFDLSALRLVDVPGLDKGLINRANALQWNRDLINTAITREIEAPARRIIREDSSGYVIEWAFVAPSACKWCDLEERGHSRRFAWLVGDHEYTAPSNRMRLARMQGRRAARLEAAGAL